MNEPAFSSADDISCPAETFVKLFCSNPLDGRSTTRIFAKMSSGSPIVNGKSELEIVKVWSSSTERVKFEVLGFAA